MSSKMENIILSPIELKVVLKAKNFLERKYNVDIFLPDCVSLGPNDVVVATVRGEKINLIKNFIQRRVTDIQQKQEQRITVQNNIPTITLSDSDSDNLLPVMENQQRRRRVRRRKKAKNNLSANEESNQNQVVDLSSTILVEDSEESANEDQVQKRLKEKPPSAANFISLNTDKENPVKSENGLQVKNTDLHNTLDNILNDSRPAPNFISLSSGRKKENTPNRMDDSVIIIDDEIPRPVSVPKCLRPVVIDGSNVAREHGKVTNTFSCRGIKIAIDYFMQRGHTQVTAFVPHFRRHVKFGTVLTTDQPLLEELAKGQHVVFTPSRRIDNKSITCYDDRFIVELATQTGGVILSNDNYRDLAAESEEFKKTINERLLMFCFVGDIIMIPKDPLGRNGPTLNNFLSFSN